jgi:hypothetical protein
MTAQKIQNPQNKCSPERKSRTSKLAKKQIIQVINKGVFIRYYLCLTNFNSFSYIIVFKMSKTCKVQFYA